MVSSSPKFIPRNTTLAFCSALLVLLAVIPAGFGSAAYGQGPTPKPATTAGRGPKLWDVDISRKGTQCVIATDHIKLWRASADKAATVRLSGPANFPFAAIDFAAGESVVEVDSDTFPIGDGASVTISDAETGATIGQIDFAVLPPQSSDSKRLAEALKERGCTDQLELLQGSAKPRE